MELKRAKVTLLPTNKGIILKTRIEPNGKGHLYFTTDEDIKEGDWSFDEDDKLWQVTKDSLFVQSINPKIIATTDPKLAEGCKEFCVTGDECGIECEMRIPKPSQAFIEKYCKLGGIDEVNVEYEETGDLDEGILILSLDPKVNSHNEITTHSIKDSWTRKEVAEKIRDFWMSGFQKRKNVENWIKENI